MKFIRNLLAALLLAPGLAVAQSLPSPAYKDISTTGGVNGTGSVARTLGSVYAGLGQTPEQYGAVCDGVTDDSVALQRWLSALASLQSTSTKAVHGWLAKSCYSSTALSVSNVGLYLDGNGPGGSQLIFASGVNGFTVDNSAWSSAIPVEIRNVAFITKGIGTGIGLTIRGNGNYQNLIRTTVLNNIRVSGDNTTHGWATGIRGYYILNGDITGVYVAGVASFSGSITGCGMYFSGGSNIVNIIAPIIDWVDIGVCVNNTNDGSTNEGVRLIDATVRASHYGMVTRGLGNHHVVQNGHYDVVKGAINIGVASTVGGDFSQVSGAFILRSAADTWSGYNFQGITVDANYPTIQRNTIWLDAGTNGGIVRQANALGIVVGDASDTTKIVRGEISGNIIAGPATGIRLLAQTKNTTVIGNQGDAFGNVSGVNVVNSGDATNTVRNNPYVNSAGVSSVSQGADLSWPAASAYLTTAKTSATGDGTQVTLAPLTAEQNIGANLNVTTGVFTAGVAGTYQVSAHATFTSVTSTFTSGSIIISGPTFTPRVVPILPSDGGGGASTQVHLNLGDQVSILASASGGTKVVGVAAGPGATRVDITLVRPD